MSVFIQARFATDGAIGIRPLLRAAGLQQRVGQAGDVEITPARGFAVLPEHILHVRIGEQARGIGIAQFLTEAKREITGNFPVGARLARRGYCGPNA